jgi:phage terminase small subunit
MAQLTPKQKKFCDNYIKSGNATESAIKAGYNKKYVATNTTKLLKNTNIQEYIEERNKQLDKKTIASLEEVLEFLTSVIDDEDANKSDRLKAADMRLKTLGAYLERVEQKTETTIKVCVDDDDG